MPPMEVLSHVTPKPFVLLSMFSMYLNINVLNLMLVLISLPEAFVLQEELSKVQL